MRSVFVALGIIVTGIILWLQACSGADPTVNGVQVQEPTDIRDPYQITAEISNSGPGKGEVLVVFRLKDLSSGIVYEETKSLQLDEDERKIIRSEIHAPRGEYEPKVQVHYPVP